MCNFSAFDLTSLSLTVEALFINFHSVPSTSNTTADSHVSAFSVWSMLVLRLLALFLSFLFVFLAKISVKAGVHQPHDGDRRKVSEKQQNQLSIWLCEKLHSVAIFLFVISTLECLKQWCTVDLPFSVSSQPQLVMAVTGLQLLQISIGRCVHSIKGQALTTSVWAQLKGTRCEE